MVKHPGVETGLPLSMESKTSVPLFEAKVRRQTQSHRQPARGRDVNRRLK